MILGRTPDPRDVPEDAALLVRREAPVHFFDHVARRGGHDEPNRIARARERSHGRGREVAGDIERVSLAEILEANGEQHREPDLAARQRRARTAWSTLVPRAQDPTAADTRARPARPALSRPRAYRSQLRPVGPNRGHGSKPAAEATQRREQRTRCRRSDRDETPTANGRPTRRRSPRGRGRERATSGSGCGTSRNGYGPIRVLTSITRALPNGSARRTRRLQRLLTTRETPGAKQARRVPPPNRFDHARR